MDNPSRLTLRIFVSSPNDVRAERERAANVLNRLKDEFAHYAALEPFFWEDQPALATDTFQCQFPEASGMDIVVGILWARIGTPLPIDKTRPDGTRYESGTVYELESAAEAHHSRGTPDLLVYRRMSDHSLPLGNDAEQQRRLEQLKALETFIARWFFHEDGSFKAAFRTFKTPDQFEQQLDKHLHKLIREKVEKAEQPCGPREGEIVFHGVPYPGLKVFGLEEAPVYYGRARALDAVKESLQAQARQNCPFLLIFGMSGSGKSSLVRAGLLHAVTATPGWIEGVDVWRWCLVRPGDATGDPLDALAQALFGDTALPELRGAGIDAERLARMLRDNPDSADLILKPTLHALADAERERRAADHSLGARLMVVIDQMEELFTLDRLDDVGRAGYVSALAALARSGLAWVIATMRSDFYPRCAELPELVAMKADRGQYDLLAPTFAEIGQMIRYPARDAALRWGRDPDQPDQALDDILQEAAWRDPKALPLLQFTLNELFRRRGDSRTLTFASYHALGGLEGALANHAEETLKGLEPDVQAVLPALVRALVTSGQGDQDPVVSNRVPLDPLRADPLRRRLLDALITARLLTTDRDDRGEPVIGFAHEALLSHWPRLQDLLGKDREFLRTRARVAAAAQRWRRENRHSDFLLHEGKPLAEARDMFKTQCADLEPDLIEFVDRSIKYRTRQRQHRTRVIASITVVVLVVVLTIAAFSFIQWQKADMNRREADEQKAVAEEQKKNAEQETARAEHHLQVVRRESFNDQLIRAGERLPLDPVGAARILGDATLCPNDLRDFVWGHLYRQTQRQRLLIRNEPSAVHAVAFSPQGWTFATAGSDGTVRLWNAADDNPKEKVVLRGHEGDVYATAFAPDGRTLASAGRDGTIRLWDAENGTPRGMLRGHEGDVTSIAFASDGLKLASAGRDGAVRLWDIKTQQPGAVLQASGDPVFSVAFGPDGHFLAAAVADQVVRIWDLASGRERLEIKGFGGIVGSLTFAPDGLSLAGASTDRGVRIWDVATGRQKAGMMGHPGPVRTVAYAPDGMSLVSVGSDGIIKLWNAANFQEMASLRGENGQDSIAFSSDGRTLAGVGSSGNVTLWDFNKRRVAKLVEGHSQRPAGIVCSADGSVMGSAFPDGSIRIWNAVTGEPRARLMGHKGLVHDMVISHNERSLASASLDGTTRLWDLITGQPRAILKLRAPGWGDASLARSVAFSPDDTTLAIAGDDGRIHLYDTLSGQEQLAFPDKLEEAELLTAKGTLVDDVHISIRNARDCLSRGKPDMALAFLRRTVLSVDRNDQVLDEPTRILLRRLLRIAILKVTTGQAPSEDIPFAPIHSLAYTKSGTLASIDDEGRLCAWDPQTGKKRATIEGKFYRFLFSPDYRFLAGVRQDRRISLIYDKLGPDGFLLTESTGIVASSRCPIALASNGWTFASADGEMIKLLNLETGQEHDGFACEPGVSGLAFAPDGHTLYGSGPSGITSWDLTPNPASVVLAGHVGEILAVATSPDGRTIAAADVGGRIHLWEDTGRYRDILRSHPNSGRTPSLDPATALGFSPDGRTLMAARSKTIDFGDVSSGIIRRSINLGQEARCRARIAFTPDGTEAILGADNGHTVIDMRTYKVNRVGTKDGNHASGARSAREGPTLAVDYADALHFDKDGKAVVAVSNRGSRNAVEAKSKVAVKVVKTGRTITEWKEEPDDVSAMTFTPDGKRLAVAHETGFVALREVQTGRISSVIETGFGKVASLVFRSGGATVLTEGPGPAIRLWDVGTGRALLTLRGHEDAINALAFSPDGRTLVASGSDWMTHLWDIYTGRHIAVLSGHESAVRSAVFTRDGTTLATAGDDGTVWIWEVATGDARATIQAHRGPSRALAFNFDGSVLATGGDDGAAKLWETGTGRSLKSFEEGSMVLGLAFTSDSRTLVAASNRGPFGLWDVTTGRRTDDADRPGADIHSFAASPDGQVLALGLSNRSIILWDTNACRKRATFECQLSSARAMAFDPAGCTLALTAGDGLIILYDAITGQERAKLKDPEDVSALVFAPDGRTLVSASRQGTIRLWKSLLGRHSAALTGPTGSVSSVVFSPDARTMATASGDGSIGLRDVVSGRQLAAFSTDSQDVKCLAFSPNGTMLASAAGWQVELFDVKQRSKSTSLQGHFGWVTAVTYSPDGRTLASAGTDRTIRLWDVSTNRVAAVLRGHTRGIHQLSFAPEGRVLASAGDAGELLLWNTSTTEVRAILPGHTGIVTALAFAPSGRVLASAGSDRTIRLWDVATNREQAVLRGHTGEVMSLTFAPDGRILASCGRDRTVRIWDVTTGREEATLWGHTGNVNGLAFTPVGRTLATAGSDQAILLWDIERARTHDEPNPLLTRMLADPDRVARLDAVAARKRSNWRIFQKLEEPVSMSFLEDTRLEDVLKYVKQATTTATYQGIPIYVDRIGLQEAEKAMSSTVRNMDLEGFALKTTLGYLLEQLDLSYRVDGGRLVITRGEGSPSVPGLDLADARDRLLAQQLESRISLAFEKETPLDDVLEFVRQTFTGVLSYNLRLISSKNDVKEIPKTGQALIVVVAVGKLLHFRIFGGDGAVVVDTSERGLYEAPRIEDLKNRLESLWPPHALTGSEKDQIIRAVASIVGLTRGHHAGIRISFDPREQIQDDLQPLSESMVQYVTRDVPLRRALTEILEPLRLTYTAKDGQVLIKLKENQRGNPKRREPGNKQEDEALGLRTPAEEEKLARQELAARRETKGTEHPETITAIDHLAGVLFRRDKLAEAERLLHEILNLRRKVLGVEQPDTIEAIDQLAGFLVNVGKPEDAEALFRQALELHQKVHGPEHPDTLEAMDGLALSLLREGKLKEADKLFRQLLDLRRKIGGPEDLATLNTTEGLAHCLVAQRKLEEAGRLFSQVFEIRGKVQGTQHYATEVALKSLVGCLELQDKLEEGEKVLRQVLEDIRTAPKQQKHYKRDTMQHLASILLDLGKPVEAEALLSQILPMQREDEIMGPVELADVIEPFGCALTRNGKAPAAEPLLREALALKREYLGEVDWATAITESLLGDCLRAQGRFREAGVHLDRSVLVLTSELDGLPNPIRIDRAANRRSSLLRSDGDVPRLRVQEALESTVRLYEEWGKPEKAAEWRLKLMNLKSKDRDGKRQVPTPTGY